jgi:lipopolysaccharide/colanic/teichoic acid biosynthesis glycosyltransferase
MKRSTDIVLAAVLLILLSPVLVLAAIGVRLSSKGPIFFRAKRVGRGGAPFEMLKFRTMHVHSGGPVITSHGDSRIFAFGSFLRKSKIDELPQFYNVLKGDLSVVGPRPEDPKIVTENYTDWMIETLDVRPGITSPGAVYYYLLGEELVDPADPERSYVMRLLPAKLAVERAYLERANFASDLKVVGLTALAVLGPPLGMHVKPDARDLAAAERWAPASFRALE